MAQCDYLLAISLAATAKKTFQLAILKLIILTWSSSIDIHQFWTNEKIYNKTFWSNIIHTCSSNIPELEIDVEIFFLPPLVAWLWKSHLSLVNRIFLIFFRYWTHDRSTLPCCSIFANIATAFFHLGTIAFGSLIIGIIRFIQAILNRIEKTLKR